MEINTNISVAGLSGSLAPRRPSSPGGEVDQASFTTALALEGELTKTPAARPDVVARARNLIADAKYPPQETIRKIALLLAVNLDQDEQ